MAELDISEISDNEPYFLGTVNCTDNTRAWYVTLPVCGGQLNLKLTLVQVYPPYHQIHTECCPMRHQ